MDWKKETKGKGLILEPMLRIKFMLISRRIRKLEKKTGESHKHDVKQKKQDAKNYTLFDSICMKSIKGKISWKSKIYDYLWGG